MNLLCFFKDIYNVFESEFSFLGKKIVDKVAYLLINQSVE